MVLASTGLVAATVMLPGLAIALKPLLTKKHSGIKRLSIERALRRLKTRRMVQITLDAGGNETLSITEAGRVRLRRLEFEDLILKIPKSWDGYWSVILFDIPERHKTARDALRMKLRSLGCFQYHKSVFVHFVPCEDEVDFIAETFQIRRYVTVFRTRSLGHQEHRAYRHFHLKPQALRR